jgi:pyruvate dehydrogenase E1 component alpha subunit
MGSGGVVAVFFGDGALAEGLIYESFNIASLWEAVGATRAVCAGR